MDCGRLIFDSSSSSSPNHHHGQMLVLGGANPIFRGTRSVNIFGGIEEGANDNGKRRPFFTSPDELLEEEYYDEQLPEKKRRLSPEQVHMLERSFEAENKLEPDRKSELAKKLGLQPRQVAVWFQNRRARWKTKQLERDYDRLKAAYDSLIADHDSLLKDNDRLRSQVASLSEKVQGKDIGALVGPTTESEIVSAVLGGGGGGGGAVVGGGKGEDHLSTGSGESVVVDGPHHHQLLDSSGESYVDFHHHHHQQQQDSCCFGDMTAVERCGVHSEEDDVGSDDGCNYGLPHGDIHNMFGGNNNSINDAAAAAAAAADDNWWGVWTSN